MFPNEIANEGELCKAAVRREVCYIDEGTVVLNGDEEGCWWGWLTLETRALLRGL